MICVVIKNYISSKYNIANLKIGENFSNISYFDDNWLIGSLNGQLKYIFKSALNCSVKNVTSKFSFITY